MFINFSLASQRVLQLIFLSEIQQSFLVVHRWQFHKTFVCSAAICCIGGMYEKLGRMVGRSYEETISLLIKALRNAEVGITDNQHIRQNGVTTPHILVLELILC